MNAPIRLQTEVPIGEEDRARADHYALIARLFHAAPDAALLVALADAGRVLGGGAEAGEEGGGTAFRRAWAALGEAAAQGSVQAAGEEFDALFVSVARPVVMLNGSWYLAGYLQEEPLAELRAALAGLGLGRRTGVSETEDHIAALAEVMRHLVLSGADAAGLARQRAFFARHLAPWYGELADCLAAAPEADFYAKAGSLLRAFLDLERAAFEMAIET